MENQKSEVRNQKQKKPRNQKRKSNTLLFFLISAF